MLEDLLVYEFNSSLKNCSVTSDFKTLNESQRLSPNQLPKRLFLANGYKSGRKFIIC